jgi:hypothetical protein
MRAYAVPALLACLLLLPGCGAAWTSNQLTAERVLELSAEHVPQSGLLIETRNGQIGVAAKPGAPQVAVVVRVRCGGATLEEARTRVEQASVTILRLDDATLQITAHLPEPGTPHDGADVWVEVPSAHGADLRTSNGRVSARGLSGPLRIDTSNGSVQVTDHDGPVRVDTSNGSIVATAVGGPTSLDTSNGSVTVELADGAAAPLLVDTDNGTITASVGSGFAGAVRLDTSNGAIHLHDDGGRIRSAHRSGDYARVIIGADGSESALDTSNGSIFLTVR